MWTDTVLGVQLCLLTFKLRYVTQQFYLWYCKISNAWNDWEGLCSGAVDCVESLDFFHRLHLSGHIMALGYTQTVIQISTGDISWG
jgi:hypothetical protein